MSKAQQTARGVIWNWIALGFSFAVTFFMTPFIVHSLGVVTYGVWALVVSITSYMTLLDLGLRGAVIRFVSSNHARGDHSEASRAVSGALWLRQWIVLIILAFSFLLALTVTRLFEIPLELRNAARWAIILSGLGVGLNLYFGVFAGVLSALHRFDLMSEISILQTVLRAAGVIWVLRSGAGILGLGGLEVTLAILMSLAQMLLCFANYPQLKISLRFPGQDTLKAFVGYSVWIFLVHIFAQVIYYTDNLVVGAFVSVSAVAFYTIAGSLIEYLRTIVASLTSTFMPLASTYEATGEAEKLRLLLINGTRIALTVALPIQLALFFRGETFLTLWMGPHYGPISGMVLRILLPGQIFTLANATSMNIAFGLAKHRRFALWLAGEALANITLSIYLARHIGINGVAIGTLVPTLVVQLILWPAYISRVVGVPLRQYLLQSWIRPGIAAIPFALICSYMDHHIHTRHLLGFFAEMFAALPVYLTCVILMFRSEIWELLRERSNGASPFAGVSRWLGKLRNSGDRRGTIPLAQLSPTQHTSVSEADAFDPQHEPSKRALSTGQRALSAPLVSIGMPVYNGEKFVGQALDSLLAQSCSSFEIIVCDNSSTDGTENVCREYAARDPRIRYFRNPINLGAARNYMRVLELAGGKYFKYAAHDDLCAPQFLQRCLEILEQRPDVVLAYPKTKIIDEINGRIFEFDDCQHLQSERASDRFAQVLRQMTLCNTIFGLFRTSELRNTAGFRRYAGADIILTAELSLHGKFYEIPEYLFFRRFHPSASSSMKDAKQLQQYLEPAIARQNRLDLREWRHLFGHFHSALRAPLSVVERVRVMLFLLRIGFWNRKRFYAELWEIIERVRGKLFRRTAYSPGEPPPPS